MNLQMEYQARVVSESLTERGLWLWYLGLAVKNLQLKCQAKVVPE